MHAEMIMFEQRDNQVKKPSHSFHTSGRGLASPGTNMLTRGSPLPLPRQAEVRKQIGRRWHCLPPTSTSKPADQIMIAVGVAQYFFFFFLPDCWALHRFWHWLVRIRTIGHSPWFDWKWSRDPSWGDIGTMNLGQTKVWHLKLVHRNKTDGEFRDVWYSLLVRLDIFDNEWSWSLVVVVCFVFARGQVGLDILLREDNQANGK